MASTLANTKGKLRNVSIVGALLLAQAAFSPTAFAEDGAKSDNAFEWSAELVSLDQGSGTATLKARIDTRADRSVLAGLNEGDAITITWTGLTWGAGIGAIDAGSSSHSEDALRLPAEFVDTELDDNYLVFRVPLPEGSAENIASLSSGAWVTATTPRDASELQQAVSEIRPYNDVS